MRAMSVCDSMPLLPQPPPHSLHDMEHTQQANACRPDCVDGWSLCLGCRPSWWLSVRRRPCRKRHPLSGSSARPGTLPLTFSVASDQSGRFPVALHSLYTVLDDVCTVNELVAGWFYPGCVLWRSNKRHYAESLMLLLSTRGASLRLLIEVGMDEANVVRWWKCLPYLVDGTGRQWHTHISSQMVHRLSICDVNRQLIFTHSYGYIQYNLLRNVTFYKWLKMAT